MKKNAFLLLMLFIPFFTRSTVIWNGIMAPGSANATDEDVQINGDTLLPAETVIIQALNQNVTINLLNSGHRLYATTNDTQTTVLSLQVNYPFTIELVIDHDLILAGVENNLDLPLFIEERRYGAGEAGLIRWTIADNCKLYFGDPYDNNRGGAFLQIINDGLIVSHIFKVNDHRDNLAQIKFNSNSGIFLVEEADTNPESFLSAVTIDASNANYNRENISFKDGSGWLFEPAV